MFILTLALILDWVAGDPDFIWRRAPHPVVWIGKVIEWADRMRYKNSVAALLGEDSKKSDLICGVTLVALLLLVSLCAAIIVEWLSSFAGPFHWVVEVLVVGVLIAQKSLFDHVKRVADDLKAKGIFGGRQAVSMIVGREVSELDTSGVSKASIESLAENFSDGVVAPAFWYAVLGLPGIMFYKAINTADSMVGHRNEKYEYFGKAAALTDDLLNWISARLTALFVCISSVFDGGLHKVADVFSIVLRDGPLHRSPNAGWPEAAFAAHLGIALGGPRIYGKERVAAPFLNASGRQSVGIVDIVRALDLFRRTCFLIILICGLLWLIF